MTVRERIKIALDRSGKSQVDLADLLQVRQGSVSGVLNRETEFDSLKYLEATERLTGYRFEWLRTGKGPEKTEDTDVLLVNEPEEKYMTELARLREENKELQIKYDALLEAFERIGSGRKSSDRYVGQ